MSRQFSMDIFSSFMTINKFEDIFVAFFTFVTSVLVTIIKRYMRHLSAYEIDKMSGIVEINM